MMKSLRRLAKPLARTPFHPQWLTGRGANSLISSLRSLDSKSRVLDVGCFNKWPREHIPPGCWYVGLDYYSTAKYWYQSTPDVFADALELPFGSQSFDVVLLLDVLEHLSDRDKAIAECVRVLAPGGRVIMQVPFLYPLHDEPRDFVRYTEHGFRELAASNELILEYCVAVGHPLETAAVLSNIALVKTVLNWIESRNPMALIFFLAPILILLRNLVARGGAMLSKRDEFMPINYQLSMRRK